MLVATLAATSALGQGYLTIASGQNQVYSGLGSTAVSGDTSLNWALYWAPAATANPFTSAASSTTGNNTTTVAQAGYTTTAAWTALNGSAFQLAYDANNAQSVIDNVQANGTVIYWTLDPAAPGQAVGIQGLANSTSYAFLEVAWSAAYATPTAASNAHGAIGWSYVSSFGPIPTDPTAGAAQNGPNFASYGVFAPVTSVPEPSSLALAGLGGFGMLMAFRRKKA